MKHSKLLTPPKEGVNENVFFVHINGTSKWIFKVNMIYIFLLCNNNPSDIFLVFFSFLYYSENYKHT